MTAARALVSSRLDDAMALAPESGAFDFYAWARDDTAGLGASYQHRLARHLAVFADGELGLSPEVYWSLLAGVRAKW